jgi:hypothetical protein
VEETSLATGVEAVPEDVADVAAREEDAVEGGDAVPNSTLNTRWFVAARSN